jgi:GrpB-like predicted nucleotidyltransferase (UPF0157 family)
VAFADELGPVVLVAHCDTWASEFDAIAASLHTLELADEGSIDHVGSTSIPGLVAKDVIDVQIRLVEIDEGLLLDRFDRAGYRRRPERWNNVEATRTGPEMKLVFAPAIGARRMNIHVRRDRTKGASDTLLFRDFLRSNDADRDGWGNFKQSIVDSGEGVDLMTYGQAKQLAWHGLMESADDWARQHAWEPEPVVAWSKT